MRNSVLFFLTLSIRCASVSQQRGESARNNSLAIGCSVAGRSGRRDAGPGLATSTEADVPLGSLELSDDHQRGGNQPEAERKESDKGGFEC